MEVGDGRLQGYTFAAALLWAVLLLILAPGSEPWRICQGRSDSSFSRRSGARHPRWCGSEPSHGHWSISGTERWSRLLTTITCASLTSSQTTLGSLTSGDSPARG